MLSQPAGIRARDGGIVENVTELAPKAVPSCPVSNDRESLRRYQVAFSIDLSGSEMESIQDFPGRCRMDPSETFIVHNSACVEGYEYVFGTGSNLTFPGHS